MMNDLVSGTFYEIYIGQQFHSYIFCHLYKNGTFFSLLC